MYVIPMPYVMLPHLDCPSEVGPEMKVVSLGWFMQSKAETGLLPEQAGVGLDGFPEPVVPPMRQLASDVPIQPALLGNLCLQQLNLWIGSSLEGSSDPITRPLKRTDQGGG